MTTEDWRAPVSEIFDGFARIEGLASALASKTPLDSIGRLLALRVLANFDVYGVALVAVDGMGRYRTLSTFGYDENEIHSLNSTGLDWKTPLAAAIRDGRSVWFDHGSSTMAQFPDLQNVPVHPSIKATICLPIGHEAPIAGLLITLRQEMEWAPREVQEGFLSTLASLLSITVDSARVRSELVSRGSRPPAQKEGTLSDRQIAILRLIAEGKTNKAIGSRLGYSESTVRHETMRIFRLLGVASRSQAVTAGASRGLLPIQRDPLT